MLLAVNQHSRIVYGDDVTLRTEVRTAKNSGINDDRLYLNRNI